MKTRSFILFLWLIISFFPRDASSQDDFSKIQIDFYGDALSLKVDPSFHIPLSDKPGEDDIHKFYQAINNTCHQELINSLTALKKLYPLDDWLYYQLIRKVAQHVSPKKKNYYRYTLYKWFLLVKSGFDATLKIHGDKLLFYVRSDDNIYNIPSFYKNQNQYVCLNYHDYGNYIDFDKEKFSEISLGHVTASKPFSYKVQQLPAFRTSDYREKQIRFTMNENEYNFKVKLNPAIRTIFSNYPVVDYESYFNIPLSKETYNTLIPAMKNAVRGMNTKNGVDYIMRFTRYAFMFGSDTDFFGQEKRLSPEQTLLYDQSDCEDRAGLFFCLIKEIYDLPMIVLSFADHVTIAVRFDKPVGKPIVHNGLIYSVCEPTPQTKDLSLGQLPPNLSGAAYHVVYAYTPDRSH